MLQVFVIGSLFLNIVGFLTAFIIGGIYVSRLASEIQRAGRVVPFLTAEDVKRQCENRRIMERGLSREFNPLDKSRWRLIPYLFSRQDEDVDKILSQKRIILVFFILLVTFVTELVVLTIFFVTSAIILYTKQPVVSLLEKPFQRPVQLYSLKKNTLVNNSPTYYKSQLRAPI